MRKNIKNCLFIFTVIFTIAACNDPIFYSISLEVRQIDARIKGSPSNFVVIGNAMYVASGRSVYKYEGGSWSEIARPGGRVLQLAATKSTNFLYALCYNDTSSGVDFTIQKYDGSNLSKKDSWSKSSTSEINSIFIGGDTLFIGIENKIFYLDSSDVRQELNITGVLIGAYEKTSTHYIATKNDGIFYGTSPSYTVTVIPNSDKKDFMGMIELNSDTIALITRSGNIYTIDTSANTIKHEEGISFSNRQATGALAIWESGSNKLLLAGRQELGYSVDSGYTYGYMELELDASGGIKAGATFREPGKESVTTVHDYERYVSTIGKNPVKYIFQAPSNVDSKMTLFASTQQKGVWSYRERSDGWQWNAED